MNDKVGGKREELAALGIRLMQARLMTASVDDDEVREPEKAVAELQHAVLQLGHPLLAARWFLGTQGLRLQRAMWPERRSPLLHEELFIRLERGCALALMAKTPDARLMLLLLLRDTDGRTDLRLRTLAADAPAPSALRTLQAMAPEVIDITLVPAGELRRIPWQHHAVCALAGGSRFRVHLSVATWWRERERATDRATGRTAQAPRWLLARHELRGTGQNPSSWAQLESRLSKRLWHAGSSVPAQQEVAVDVHKDIHIDGGSLEQAFAGGLRFAMVPLGRCHEADIALFSLAYRWCLCCALDQPAPDGNVDYVDVFDLLQASLRMGEWPPGFACWLLDELPCALEEAVPGLATALADEAAERERKAWFAVLAALAAELDVPGSMPAPNRCWRSFYDRLSMALSQRAPRRLQAAARSMVALGE